MSAVLDHLRLMARNNAYANELLHEACCKLSQEEFEAERAGFFPSILATLNHIWAVDRYYVDALCEEGSGRSVYRTPPLETAEELRTAQKREDDKLIRFCDGLGEADIERRIAQDRGEAGVFQETVGNTLLHLFQHQIHHRGQVHAMLSGTGVAPPQLDEFFLEFDRHPAAEKYM
ncbi:DinB family protein [Roseibium aggregatum]|uniref:Damage-inducible protein DinB n=1 Tax=Roseibium aggregatum TaxID=187304 RepID=A0A939EAX1_9HYPH|nr:DinB family protein [Roseibium aggregatum]MBN9669573.1 damage-inducible protein DinB [Roseibium aggregatum]